MLRDDEFTLLWSTWIDEEICSDIYEDNVTENCKNCGYDVDFKELSDECGGEENICKSDYCPYVSHNCCGMDYDYDFMYEMIEEQLEQKFGENEYQYFVKGHSCFWYGGWSGNKPNMEGFSDVYDNINEILKMLNDDDYRIYKGKYNTLWVETSNHDGSRLFQICRLNKKGQEYYNKNYNFDFRKYCVKGVLKDFPFYNWKQ